MKQVKNSEKGAWSLTMKKRITTLLVCFTMMIVMLASAVPVFAGSDYQDFPITADKTTAYPGDEITYEVKLEQSGDDVQISAFKFNITIPDGLTVVENSGSVPAETNIALGTDIEWTPNDANGPMLSWTAAGEGYYDGNGVTLVTFKCKVKENAAGSTQVVKIDKENIAAKYGPAREYGSIPTFTFLDYSASVTINEPIAATKVTLNKDELPLNVGAEETLTATVAPADSTDKVKWSSDNTSVATVEESTGKVTAVAPGTATITATAGSKSAACTVTVTCTHTNKITVPAKESTCITKGYDEYKQCATCPQLFDMDESEIDAIPERELAPHTFSEDVWDYKDANGHAHSCKTEGCTAHSDIVPHVPGAAATETSDQVCTECGYVIAEKTSHISATEEPAANNATAENSQASPKTGDNSNIVLWLALILVSGGAVTVTTITGKKRKYNK